MYAMIIMTVAGDGAQPSLPPVCLYAPLPSRGICLAIYPLPDVPLCPFVSPLNTSNMKIVPPHKWSDREVKMIYEACASLLQRFESTSFYVELLEMTAVL